MTETASVRRVTREVDPAAVRDLLDRPPRATVAFVVGGAADLVPARARADGDRHLFAVAAEAAPALDGAEVVLIVDDGPYWFQLRGVSVRGVARSIDGPPDAQTAEVAWYAIDTQRLLAWDYGAVREE